MTFKLVPWALVWAFVYTTISFSAQAAKPSPEFLFVQGMMLIDDGKKEALEEFIRQHPDIVTIKDKRGRTLLHQAAALDRSVIARLLLEHKAEVNAQDNVSDTPLHLATAMSEDITSLIFSSGGNPDLPNKAGQSPRDIAREIDCDHIFDTPAAAASDIDSPFTIPKCIIPDTTFMALQAAFAQMFIQEPTSAGPASSHRDTPSDSKDSKEVKSVSKRRLPASTPATTGTKGDLLYLLNALIRTDKAEVSDQTIIDTILHHQAVLATCDHDMLYGLALSASKAERPKVSERLTTIMMHSGLIGPARVRLAPASRSSGSSSSGSGSASSSR